MRSWTFKMAKAYFFDWMSTLGGVDNEKSIRNIITQEEHEALLTNRFNDINLNEGRSKEVNLKLSGAKLHLYQDSEKIIKSLKRKYSLAIISNIYEITSQRIKKLFPDFLEKFDFITWSCEVGMRKPNQEIFKYTLEKLNEYKGLNIFPHEVIMVGDSSDKDIVPAVQLGMQTRLIDRNKQNLNDII